MSTIRREDTAMETNLRDPVNHPEHYTSHPSGVECIEVTEHMNFCVGNAMKYLWRHSLKGGIEDLRKAQWYINREIRRLEEDAITRPLPLVPEDEPGEEVGVCASIQGNPLEGCGGTPAQTSEEDDPLQDDWQKRYAKKFKGVFNSRGEIVDAKVGSIPESFASTGVE